MNFLKNWSGIKKVGSLYRKSSPCPLCGEKKKIEFLMNHTEGCQYSLFECEKCHFQFWIPFKNIGSDWYEKANFYNLSDLIPPRIHKDYHKKFLRLYKRFPHGMKILDVGCGTGELLHEIKRRGGEGFGVDFDKHAIETAKSRFHLKNVWAMPFEKFFQKKNLPYFDMILAFEVIEHMDNPIKFVKNLRASLKSSGCIIVSTPNRERMLVNLAVWDFPPHHLSRWNKETLERLFKTIDFKIDHSEYINEFQMLCGSVNTLFRFGGVNKSANLMSPASPSRLAKNVIGAIRILASVKQYVIGTMPALFLWIISKITGRTNGRMFLRFVSYK